MWQTLTEPAPHAAMVTLQQPLVLANPSGTVALPLALGGMVQLWCPVP